MAESSPPGQIHAPAALPTSIVRTIVPIVVGYLISIGVVNWLGITNEQATGAATAVVTGVYYVLARIFETWFSPKLGWLLGLPSQPAYASRNGRHEAGALPRRVEAGDA